MSRRSIFFGPNQVDADRQYIGLQTFPSQPPPVWPDIDTRYDASLGRTAPGKYVGRTEDVQDARAFCLAPETDWDLLTLVLYTKDGVERVPLSPGRIYRPTSKVSRIAVEPLLRAPATRLTSHQGVGFFDLRPPDLDRSVYQYEYGANMGVLYLFQHSGGAHNIWSWDGSQWNQDTAIVDGTAAANQICQIDDDDPSHPHAADLSPDGIWSFADYLQTGNIPEEHSPRTGHGADYTGPIYASVQTVDNNGNPGDANNPQTLLYTSAFRAFPSSKWYGAAAVEVWEGEDPCNYQPKLPPMRVLSIGELDLVASGVPGTPDQVLVTVPAFNVESAQFTFDVADDSDRGACAQLASPVDDAPIDELCANTTAAEDTPVGDTGAVALLNNVQHYLQVQLGEGTAGSGSHVAKIRRANLVLFRKVTG